MSGYTRINISLPADLLERLKRRALAEQRSLTDMARAIVIGELEHPDEPEGGQASERGTT